MFQFLRTLFAPKAAGTPNLKARLAVDGMEDRCAPSSVVLGPMAVHGSCYPDHNNRALTPGGDTHGVGDPQMSPGGARGIIVDF